MDLVGKHVCTCSISCRALFSLAAVREDDTVSRSHHTSWPSLAFNMSTSNVDMHDKLASMQRCCRVTLDIAV